MNRHTTLYLDGLERSGNVYLSSVIEKTMNVNLISVRTHDINTLKNYERINPFIVPVRDAFPSILSSKLYRDYVFNNNLYGDTDPDNVKLDTIVSRYKEYIDFLLISPKFFIAPFHCFTEDHNETCEKIVKFHEKNSKLTIKARLTKEEMFAEINSDHKKLSNSDVWFHNELGNFPRHESEDKERVKQILVDKYSEDIKDIQDGINILYQRYYDIKI